MSVRHRIYPDLSLGVLWFNGVCTGDDVVEALTLLYGDPAWRPGYATMWDLRHIVQFIVSMEDLAAVDVRSRELYDRRGEGKLAFVVRRELEEHVFHLFLSRKISPPRPTRYFDQMSNALDWLGVVNPPQELQS